MPMQRQSLSRFQDIAYGAAIPDLLPHELEDRSGFSRSVLRRLQETEHACALEARNVRPTGAGGACGVINTVAKDAFDQPAGLRARSPAATT